MGVIKFSILLGKGWNNLVTNVLVMVINALASYNTILVRPTIHPHIIVLSTIHQKMKFATPYEIGEVQGNKRITGSCYVICLKRRNQRENLAIETKVEEEKESPLLVEEPVEVKIDKPNKKVRIRTNFTNE